MTWGWVAAGLLCALQAWRWYRARRDAARALRLQQADWRAKSRLANEGRVDAEKANRRVAVLPFHRTCACGAEFDRSPMVVDMRCDACQAKAFDETLEADRDDWSKGGDVIRKGWQ